MIRRVSRGGARETHICGLAHLQQCSRDVGSQGDLIINSTLEGDRETGSQGCSQHVQELCHISENWEPNIRVPEWSSSGESPCLSVRLQTSQCVIRSERGLGALWILFYKSTNPS